MATESGRTSASVRDRLYERPAAFDFFQAVRLLRMLRGGRVGGDDPESEAVRFRSEVSLAFPRADITGLVPPGEEQAAPVMTVGFMGLATAGSFGSLPTTYAEEIAEQEQNKNFALRDFFDLFNHRLVSLFYRAFEKQSLTAQFERGHDDFYQRALFGVIGLGTPGLHGRGAVPDGGLLARAGLLAMSPMPASALKGLLTSYFQVPVEIEQFMPAWYEIEEAERSRLGRASSRLGEDLFLGSSVRLEEFRFGVRLGPLGWDQYQEFFPGSQGFRALVDLVQLSVTPDLDFEVRLVLTAEDVPPLRLERQPTTACRLGWSTWLTGEPFEHDVDDAVLEPAAAGSSVPGAVRNSPDPMEVQP